NDFVAAGFLSAPVPAAATIGSPFNLMLAVIVVAAMTAQVAALHPRREDTFVVDPALLAEPADDESEEPGGFIDRSPVVTALLALAAAVYLARAFVQRGLAALDINTVN